MTHCEYVAEVNRIKKVIRNAQKTEARIRRQTRETRDDPAWTAERRHARQMRSNAANNLVFEMRQRLDDLRHGQRKAN